MAMNKQTKLYSIGLGLTKTEYEKELYNLQYQLNHRTYLLKKKHKEIVNEDLGEEISTEERKEYMKKLEEVPTTIEIDTIKWINGKKETIITEETLVYSEVKEEYADVTHKIKEEIKKNKFRTVYTKDFRIKNEITFFDNATIRTIKARKQELGLELADENKPTLDFIVMEVGNTDMIITEQVIKNGITIVDEKIDEETGELISSNEYRYKFFTAGAGQTRQKKFMMIKEDLWETTEKHLMCGLTIDKINEMGGMNANKFCAYLSLNNSASEIYEDFDIDKCIVVDDYSSLIRGEVDYISRDDKILDEKKCVYDENGVRTKTVYKTDWEITRQVMDISIDFMDGAGICLTKIFKKNTQIRLPWFKGLVCPFNYLRYIKENNLSTKVKDIYGKEYDVVEDDIQIIFTKSQFKLWKYYKDWDEYKENFKKYNCTFNICMQDEPRLKDMNINYQMLQTLTDMTDEQIEYLTADTKKLIEDVHVDRDSQLKLLSATKSNKRKNNFQTALMLYPEMLTSKYVKNQVRDVLASYRKDAKSGRIDLNAKRVFIIPDLIHFSSLLFGDGSDYYLEANEVYFEEYKDSERLALLRSPHLSREWFMAKNKASNTKSNYFNTKAIYVSAKDFMSLVLMCDWDGDEALVVKDNAKQKWLLDLAEEQMKDIRPLYYEMGGGEAKQLTINNIFKSLEFVYKKSNIGKVSNTLTNITSQHRYEDKEDEIKKLCAYNNWIIDSAKKLELPRLPQDIKQLMNNNDYPHFFKFAKDKKDNECREIGNGVIDRICKSIDHVKYKRFSYKKGFGTFKLETLLHNKNVKDLAFVLTKYEEIESQTKDKIRTRAKAEENATTKSDIKTDVYIDAKESFIIYAKEKGIDYNDMVDYIVKDAFLNHENNLTFIFNVFGDTIINNINDNIDYKSLEKGYRICNECGERFKSNSPRQKYCNECSKKVNIEKTIDNRTRRKGEGNEK
ncbi:hypothetical protein PMX22_15810 [Clostridium butyricum]|uniref:hypothetical protein n=1 Tax=Clostridium butyricum TaxID=1492 RepID=UPI002061B6F0|nr:hypothetical protein [Clostridium butyricum]MDB2161263.1 hypothetical protein [Clostridium butyricum]DAQ97701.1 MAG TPA: RNA dependent RNA polymerase [Caudoviricetes sp.]